MPADAGCWAFTIDTAHVIALPGPKHTVPMPIGRLTLELYIPYAQSLKDRRQVLRSLKDKLRHSFNLSVAEMNEGGIVWNQATLAIAVISSSTQVLTQRLQSIDNAAHRMTHSLSAEISDSYAEILPD